MIKTDSGASPQEFGGMSIVIVVFALCVCRYFWIAAERLAAILALALAGLPLLCARGPTSGSRTQS